MTREEAIKGLEGLARNFGGYKPNEEMFDMAIEALKTEPCEDAVSLDAVINTIEWYRTNPQHFTEDNLIEDMKGLPPVTPKQRTGHWITQWNVVHQTEYYYCSECREEFSYDGEIGIKMNDYDFCPHCGAKLEGVSE